MKIITLGKIIAAAILTLGVIHNIATFTPVIKDSLLCLTAAELDFVLYMSLICGFSLIVSGLLLIILLNKLLDYPFLINPVIILGVFLGFNAFFLFIFSHNIFDNIFAVIALILNLTMCCLSAILAIKIKQKRQMKKWYNYLG